MEFNVPKNIEIEDKVVGPLTLKQFLYLAGAGAILFAIWFLVDKIWTFVVFAIPIVGVSLVVAFLKINGRPFLTFTATFFNFMIKPKLYIWKKKND